MTGPAHGFTGNAGYLAGWRRIAAVGNKVMVTITCQDGALAWTIDAGEGGNQWEQGEPLTFYWQSTMPPSRPRRALRGARQLQLRIGHGSLPGRGRRCDQCVRRTRCHGTGCIVEKPL